MTDRSTTEQLGDILDWAALLPALLTRRAPTGDNSRGGRGTPGSRPPARLDVLHVLDTRLRVTGDDAEDRAWHDRMASDHRQGLLPDLWQWARMIEAEALEGCPDVPDELPEAPTLASVVGQDFFPVGLSPHRIAMPGSREKIIQVHQHGTILHIIFPFQIRNTGRQPFLHFRQRQVVALPGIAVVPA